MRGIAPREGQRRKIPRKENLGSKISLKVLMQTLRGLERDGLFSRTRYPTSLPEPSTSLRRWGASLIEPPKTLCHWAEAHAEEP